MSLAATAPGRALLGRRRPGTLPWLVAATAFLAILGLAAALALAGAARTLAGAGIGRYTIELVDAEPARRDAAAARLLAAARALPGTAAAARVPPAELARLVAPVLGRLPADAVPLPALIDLALEPGASPRPLALLVARTPGASLIAAADDLAPLAALVRALRGLALGVALVAGVVTLLTAVLAARAMLAAHGPTLAILHALGASDGDIAALVQRRAGRDALIGGLAGFGGALLAILLLRARYAALDVPAARGAALGPTGWLALGLLPLLLAAGATLAARLEVLRVLGRQP